MAVTLDNVYYLGTEIVDVVDPVHQKYGSERERDATMTQFLLAAAPLACPIGMGVMMWMMMRGNHSPADAEQREVAQLRADIAELKSSRAHQL